MGLTMGNRCSVSRPPLAFVRLEGAWVTAAGVGDRPAVVADGPVVADVSPAARAAGLRPGMRVQGARRLLPGLAVVPRDEIDPLAALEPLYEALLGVSPRVEPAVDRMAAFCELDARQTVDGVVAVLQAAGLARYGDRLVLGIGQGRLVARMAARVAARSRAAAARGRGGAGRGGTGRSAAGPETAGRRSGRGADAETDAGRSLAVVSCRVPPGQEAAFLAPMPVAALQEEVAPAARRQLQRLGLMTLGDVAAAPRQVVARAVGDLAPLLQAWCRGDDRRPLVPGFPPPGVTAVLAAPPELADDLRAGWWSAQLPRLAQEVAARLAAAGRAGRLAVLQGERARASRHLPAAVAGADVLTRAALDLYRRLLRDEPAPARLALTVTALEPAVRQLSLADPVQEDRPVLLDELARRYPGRIFWGRERPVSRRERQLAYWDPWRGAPGGAGP